MGEREGGRNPEKLSSLGSGISWLWHWGRGVCRKAFSAARSCRYLSVGLFQMRKRRNSFPTEAKGENVGEN